MHIWTLGVIPMSMYPVNVWKNPVAPTKIELTVKNVNMSVNAALKLIIILRIPLKDDMEPKIPLVPIAEEKRHHLI